MTWRVAIRSMAMRVATALALLALTPVLSYACPTCFAASGPHGLRAYYLSTMLLSTMPFIMIGVIALIAYAAKRERPETGDASPLDSDNSGV